MAAVYSARPALIIALELAFHISEQQKSCNPAGQYHHFLLAGLGA